MYLDSGIERLDLSIVERLAREEILEVEGSRRATPLAQVARDYRRREAQNDKAAVSFREGIDLLIERGASLTTPSAFRALCAAGLLDLVQAALRRGADLNRPSASDAELGNSPLAAALENDRLDVARLLLERGADPARYAEGTRPAIHYIRSVEALDLLLSFGADVRAVDLTYSRDPGYTVIFTVARREILRERLDPATKVALVSRLAALGFSLQEKNKGGRASRISSPPRASARSPERDGGGTQWKERELESSLHATS